MQFDVFCQVIDNYGDAGIVLRLAKQLVYRYNAFVRVIGNDMSLLMRLLSPSERSMITIRSNAYGESAARQSMSDVFSHEAQSPFIFSKQNQSYDHVYERLVQLALIEWQLVEQQPFVVDEVLVSQLVNHPTTQPDIKPVVVIETFGCGLPPAYENYRWGAWSLDDELFASVSQMNSGAFKLARPTQTPIRADYWINLDYFSCESWITDWHGRSSPHTKYPQVKRFFWFPSFLPHSAGVIGKRQAKMFGNVAKPSAVGTLPSADCISAQELFRLPTCQELFGNNSTYRHAAIDVRHSNTVALKVGVFAYAHAPIVVLIEALMKILTKNHQLCIELWLLDYDRLGLTYDENDCEFYGPHGRIKVAPVRDRLRIFTPPFMPQVTFDEWLDDMDWLFVRGEDSFIQSVVRGKPTIWHIYPQNEQAHLEKLWAFFQHYWHHQSVMNDRDTDHEQLIDTKTITTDWCRLVEEITESWNTGLSNWDSSLRSTFVEQIETLWHVLPVWKNYAKSYARLFQDNDLVDKIYSFAVDNCQ